MLKRASFLPKEMLKEEAKAKESCRQHGKVPVVVNCWQSCSRLWEWGWQTTSRESHWHPMHRGTWITRMYYSCCGFCIFQCEHFLTTEMLWNSRSPFHICIDGPVLKNLPTVSPGKRGSEHTTSAPGATAVLTKQIQVWSGLPAINIRA